MRRINAATTMEDLLKNPTQFGIPSFETYKKNRHIWNPGAVEESGMIALTDGPKLFRRDLNKITFRVHGHDCKEEQVEKRLGDFGYTLSDIDLENRNSRLRKTINMIPQGGGKYDLVVDFLP